MRGGEGTENPDLDRPAMSVGLDREDINYLVSDYLKRLEASPFWQDSILGASTPPVAAISPYRLSRRSASSALPGRWWLPEQ